MKAKKKNKVITFICSLIPGAGEMYMGFMRTGICLMTLFALLFYIPLTLQMPELILLDIVVWFYGFFRANHLSGLSEEEFEQIEDRPMFELERPGSEKRRWEYVPSDRAMGWVAVLLILAGGILLLNTLTDIAGSMGLEVFYNLMWPVRNYAPRLLTAAAVLIIGIRMIRGRKARLKEMKAAESEETGAEAVADTADGTEEVKEE